jgi:hypothetical protein
MWTSGFSIGFQEVIRMSNDTYTHERTIEFPNMKVRVFRPVLTETEKSKRMQNIHKASSNLMKEVMKK